MEEVKEVCVEDKNSVERDISSLKQDVFEIRFLINSVLDALSSQKKTENQTENAQIKTIQAQNPTLGAQNSPPNTPFSTGNEGVPTDRQTDTRQADIKQVDSGQDLVSMMANIKTELKIKFRKLTKQEFKVFSAVYILEEQGEVDYRMLADKLALSESSIRDYVMKMERKGIPISKERVHNKRVLLHIGKELREIAPLQTIMEVREHFSRN